jgi:hypothetical protein
MKLLHKRDGTVKTGIVKEVRKIEKTNENRFIVEVWDKSQHIPVVCSYIAKFGGIYNYEEYNWRGFSAGEDEAGRGEYSVRPGDTVLIAYINGTSQEGVILGALKHPGRAPQFEPEDGVVYASEFNGLKKEINIDGEYTTTFRGIQTNITDLDKAPDGNPIPEPKYDEEVGTTFTKFDKTGGWITSDNATSDPQSIHIDKEGGRIIVTSGKIVLTMEKSGELTSLTTSELKIDALKKMDTSTQDWATVASKTAKIKSPKIAFGTDGTELLDQIIKALEGLGKVKPISPVGPCAPLTATPEWGEVARIISKINGIKGSL